MAKTFQQIVQEEMGGLQLKILELTAVNELLREENEKLKAANATPAPKDTPDGNT